MIQPPAGATTTKPPVVATRGLVKRIDDRPILRNVNFSVEAGEYVAILGGNGAGKSTLLKILATLWGPTEGEVRLFGRTTRGASPDVRRQIGLIDHQPLLYRDLTAAENLEFFASLYGLSNPTKRARQMLDRFGLLHRANDPVKAFSRGMVQRVSIARALLHEPELILADEPFAGLDAPSAEAVEQVFADLTAGGTTVIVVNHDIEQTLRIADRVIVLRGGTVVVDDPTHRLYLQELRAEVATP